MRRSPQTLPELGFIVLVMVLPLVVGFAWRSETFWAFLGTVTIGMVVGFSIWLTLVLLTCRHCDRKRRDLP